MIEHQPHRDTGPAEQLFDVVVKLPPEGEGWPPFASEKVWAAKTSTKLHLALRNVPFYARGLAWGDVIRVRPDRIRRQIVFRELVERSGHSTIRVIPMRPDAMDRIRQLLDDAGCTWEGDGSGLIAVDVAPEVDYAAFREHLFELENNGLLEFQEGYVSPGHEQQLPEPGL